MTIEANFGPRWRILDPRLFKAVFEVEYQNTNSQKNDS